MLVKLALQPTAANCLQLPTKTATHEDSPKRFGLSFFVASARYPDVEPRPGEERDSNLSVERSYLSVVSDLMLKDSPCGYHITSQCQLGFAADQTALPTLTGDLRFFFDSLFV
jgi:hypothetical protein